ncbi:MAG: hypothetical protein CMJ83_00945 [Planctomycetes bacterium]|nr:hypothetical protein [Planctomycetota bacterium]
MLNRTLALSLFVTLLLGASAGAQDFHFISSRDSGAGDLNYEIYRYQNGTETRVTTTPVIEQHPIWSGLNNQLFFVAPTPQGSEIVTLLPFLGGMQPLPILNITGGPESYSHPFLAPDELSLFIVAELGTGESMIRRVGLGGQDLGVIVADPSDVHSPATANTPAGPKLYYSSNRDGDFEIYRCDLDGNNTQPLTTNAIPDGGAMPSPDGTKIAFTRQDPFDQCTTHVWVMDHDGQNQNQVTAPGANGKKFTFGWADNNQILYVCESGANDLQICTVGTNGLNQNLLVNGGGHDRYEVADCSWDHNAADLFAS